MSVAIDAIGGSSVAGAGPGATSVNFTALTIVLGDALLAFVQFWSSSTPSGITMTWGAQSLTQIITATAPGPGVIVQLWGLLAPLSGNRTLNMSWTGGNWAQIDAISFTGVSQSSFATAFPNAVSGTGTGTNPSIIVTSASNNYTAASYSTDTNFVSTNQTQLYVSNDFAEGGGAYALGAPTVAFNGVQSGSGNWAAVGCDIAAAQNFVRTFLFTA